jgi:hypothetical protein
MKNVAGILEPGERAVTMHERCIQKKNTQEKHGESRGFGPACVSMCAICSVIHRGRHGEAPCQAKIEAHIISEIISLPPPVWPRGHPWNGLFKTY